MAETRKKRPCAVCRRWFRPQAKVKHRAKTCGSQECQKEWHRRQCQQWNRRNKAYFRSNYLQKKLDQANGFDSYIEKDLSPAAIRQRSSAGFPESPLEPVSSVVVSHLMIIVEYVIQAHIRDFRNKVAVTRPANKGSPIF